MKLITIGIIIAVLLVAGTLVYEKFVPLSVKQTLQDMMRIIKGK